MNAFHAIHEKGGGGFTVVSRGISEALVATALGLAVAGPFAYFLVRYVSARIQRVVLLAVIVRDRSVAVIGVERSLDDIDRGVIRERRARLEPRLAARDRDQPLSRSLPALSLTFRRHQRATSCPHLPATPAAPTPCQCPPRRRPGRRRSRPGSNPMLSRRRLVLSAGAAATIGSVGAVASLGSSGSANSGRFVSARAARPNNC